MFYIPIQKDFSKVKNKLALGLTKRQIVCFLFAGGVGIPTYLLLKRVVTNDIAALLMIVVMIPFFLFALYEKEGQPLEQIIKNVIQEKYLRPQIRPVANEPVMMSVIQIADYVEEQERVRREGLEKSMKTHLKKLMKGREGNEKGKSKAREEKLLS